MGFLGGLPEGESANKIRMAILVVFAVVLIYYIVTVLGKLRKREKFVSKEAKMVHDRAQEVFKDGGGDASYSNYKGKVPGADPVQYKDVRELYRSGNMSPSAVQAVI